MLKQGLKMQQIKTIQIRVTIREYESLKQRATLRGLKLSAYIDSLIKKKPLKRRITNQEIETMRAIKYHNPKLSYADVGRNYGLSHLETYHLLNKPKRDAKGRILKRVDNETNNKTL